MNIQKRPAIRQIQPMGLRGRFEATRAPTMGKAKKGEKIKRSAMPPAEVRTAGTAIRKESSANVKPATNIPTERTPSDQARPEVMRRLIARPPVARARRVPAAAYPSRHRRAPH